MKRILYCILIVAAWVVPTRPLELGKLKPVEVIRIEQNGDQIVIETDTGDSGRGMTINQAIWNLRETTAGTVYLDTAEYILIPKDETIAEQISPYLKNTVRLCNWEGEMKLEEVAQYLNAHKPRMVLKQYNVGMPLQTLVGERGKFQLLEKNIEKREKTT